jgi:CAP12/Pycsar effector protein, TIR domain
LTRALGGLASVSPWPREFKLTETYIESLEKLLETTDFAVLVLTPDDETTSRTKYALFPQQDRDAALNSACSQIAEAIKEAITALPSRPRLDNAECEAQIAMRKFYDRIKGAWWERIKLKE